ncbi:Uncharacterised protein [Mycobacteroides abscessus subsp. abscessus]|nr:Uncharacterised protein [Mycobacteroides abscessus subsp. abscessus]
MFVAGSEYCAAAGWAFNQFGWFVEYRAPGGELASTEGYFGVCDRLTE